MRIDNQFYLQKHPNLQKYLHENPIYYKQLNRDPEFIVELERIFRKEYKLTLPDKMNQVKDKLDMLNTFIDILN